MTQSSDFDSSAVTNLIGLWDFSQGATTQDTGLADGYAQNGQFAGNAYASGGKAYFDGSGDRFDVRGEDTPFDGDQGTIEVQFSRAGHVGSDPDTLVNRGETCDAATEGYFNVSVTSTGAVKVTHIANGEEVVMTSDSGLAGIGQTVNVKYSWDAETGGQLMVENLSTGASQTLGHEVTGLDMDIGDNDDERFTFGAREYDDGAYDQYFKGSISHVAVYDSLMPGLDGVVEGTAGNDTIDIAYTGDPEGDRIDNNDALAPAGSNDDIVEAGAGNDTVKAGDGNDTVYGGSGSDRLEGGAGNDTLYGDSSYGDGIGTVRESFEWDKAPHPDSHLPITDDVDLDHSFTQNTGSVNVTYTAVTQSSGVDTVYSETAQNVAGVQGDGTPIDTTSGLSSTTNGQNNYARYELAFSTAVSDVSFNINDIDGDAQVRVSAWDADGNPIQVSLMGGSAMQLFDTDGVPGNDAADANEGYGDATDAKHTLNVSIAGPVAKISIEHYQNGGDNSGILVTDVFFDAPGPDMGADGNDTLIGGMGDDILYGEGGNDTLEGGSGDDRLFGGDGIDNISGGSGSDYVEGGAGNDIIDTSGPNTSNLPDRGFPSYNGFPAVPADPDAFNDRDTVYGGDGDDVITTGDDNDIIFGGAGDDVIDGGLDDDTIDGGEGKDFIVGGEGSDVIDGGAGDDTIYGGLNPAYPDATNIRDNGSNGQPDPVTDNGNDVIHGGDGNDRIFGQDDDDTIYGDDGDDYIEGGIDDDSLYGGAGDDTIFGGQGNDLLDGGAGDDFLSGGDDRDTFVNVNGGDEVRGGAGFSLTEADDYDTLDLRGSVA
ncbi:MAG: calcium-binding protein, partial [Pseudomonadota bacterium]|nr:calcium-binding protein [Pseudomonadota bacterium]